MKLGFVGGGTMAEAMVAGLLKTNTAAAGDVVVSDVLGELIVVYTSLAGGGEILFRTSDAQTIGFGPIQSLMPGLDLNDATSLGQTFLDELIVMATTKGPSRQLLGISLAP